MMSEEDAKRYLETTDFKKVELAEIDLMRTVYFHEDEKITDLEKRVLDVTKANFAVFGAVTLFSNTSFFVKAYGDLMTSLVALIVIALVSLAASIYIVLIHKYIRVHHQKVSFLQRGVWRGRPLEWLEAKYVDEKLKAQFADTGKLGVLEFIGHRYTMKYINLIPLFVALLGCAYISVQFVCDRWQIIPRDRITLQTAFAACWPSATAAFGPGAYSPEAKQATIGS